MTSVVDLSAREFIAKLADMAEAVGWQAGVGGSETAGQIVSYLAAHPDDLEKIMAGGIMDLPDNWWRHGRLTWHGRNGDIVHPEAARRAAVVRGMLAAALSPQV